uniref:Uncharacterized protein n=1 Tax=Rhizophora mucronata TaxID=61149 RepID=A0A2P2PB02_RHIMU
MTFPEPPLTTCSPTTMKQVLHCLEFFKSASKSIRLLQDSQDAFSVENNSSYPMQ